jgi:hypothetical protein
MNRVSIYTVIAYMTMCLGSPCSAKADLDWERFFTALEAVETGGKDDPDNVVGDNGKAIGRYQIHKVYWEDAVKFDPSIGGKYEDCTNPTYARKIVRAYLLRYGKKLVEDGSDAAAASLARVHNGGPKGSTKKATEGYGTKFLRLWRAKP